MSPLQRSLAFMREKNYLVEKVEHWNQWSKTRHDLFGILDLLCIDKSGGRTVGVQVTSMSGKNPHIKKMQESPNLKWLLQAGWRIHLHSWRKLKKTGWTVDIKEFES